MLRLDTPSRLGARTEAAVSSALARCGFDVYAPIFSINGRVDLVYDRAGQLVRVQCKTARVARTALYFPTTSNTGNVPIGYAGEVDEFGVYAPSTNLVYLVPIADAPARGCNLRIVPTRNNQAAGVRWAMDYELGPP